MIIPRVVKIIIFLATLYASIYPAQTKVVGVYCNPEPDQYGIGCIEFREDGKAVFEMPMVGRVYNDYEIKGNMVYVKVKDGYHAFIIKDIDTLSGEALPFRGYYKRMKADKK